MHENLPERLKDLINLGIAREEWLSGTHLGKNAADRPHVNTGRVLSTTK